MSKATNAARARKAAKKAAPDPYDPKPCEPETALAHVREATRHLEGAVIALDQLVFDAKMRGHDA
jgi:hypothetical protein